MIRRRLARLGSAWLRRIPEPFGTPGAPRIDWQDAHAFYVGLGPGLRSYARVAEEFGVTTRAVEMHAREHRWRERVQAIDAHRGRLAQQRAIRRLDERLDDSLRIVEAGRVRYAERLRDPTYQMSGTEFVSLAKLELEINARQDGSSSISEEFKDALRRLPVYVQERIIISHMTGTPIEELMALEPSIEAELNGDDDGAGAALRPRSPRPQGGRRVRLPSLRGVSGEPL
jgi:hypothetical protein